jgi:hypothetical protein
MVSQNSAPHYLHHGIYVVILSERSESQTGPPSVPVKGSLGDRIPPMYSRLHSCHKRTLPPPSRVASLFTLSSRAEPKRGLPRPRRVALGGSVICIWCGRRAASLRFSQGCGFFLRLFRVV